MLEPIDHQIHRLINFQADMEQLLQIHCWQKQLQQTIVALKKALQQCRDVPAFDLGQCQQHLFVVTFDQF